MNNINSYFMKYPITTNASTSFINRDYSVSTTKDPKCLESQTYKESCDPNVMYGYQKPLNEQCASITGGMVPPEEQCNSLWNNMTRRKTLIKDY
jgi:hypothetical protein